MEFSHYDEKRAYKRFTNKEPIRIEFKDCEFSAGCLSYDLSEGGVKFQHNDFIPLGQKVHLEVGLSNKEVVYCTGRVAWVQKMPHSHRYQIGVQFMDDSLIYDARSRIHAFFQEDE